MLDGARRSVIFHGVNVVYKVAPYIPTQGSFDSQSSLNDKDIDDLVKWGFNFVRLGVMWEAVERQPGVYDEAYLNEVEKLVNKLGARGIYTLVDAHQDVLARRICGEGFPDFYMTDDLLKTKCEGSPIANILDKLGLCKSIKSYNFRYDENGDPLIEDCQKNNFVMYYATAESTSAFERLWTNKPDGLQDKFMAYWNKVAERFSTNPYIVGYDPINEPFPANCFADPTLFGIPGKFDRTYLQPFEKRAYDIYQKHDKSKIMFWEPTQFPDFIPLFGGIALTLGYTETPGGAQNAET